MESNFIHTFSGISLKFSGFSYSLFFFWHMLLPWTLLNALKISILWFFNLCCHPLPLWCFSLAMASVEPKKPGICVSKVGIKLIEFYEFYYFKDLCQAFGPSERTQRRYMETQLQRYMRAVGVELSERMVYSTAWSNPIVIWGIIFLHSAAGVRFEFFSCSWLKLWSLQREKKGKKGAYTVILWDNFSAVHIWVTFKLQVVCFRDV